MGSITKELNRLPYGLWVDVKNETETLFDRKYKAIASRTLRQPWKVEMHEPELFLKHTHERWFYSDGCSPRRSLNARDRCKEVFKCFLDGQNVRGFLKKQMPPDVTGGKFRSSKLTPRPKK